jgi:hypothetical protein
MKKKLLLLLMAVLTMLSLSGCWEGHGHGFHHNGGGNHQRW